MNLSQQLCKICGLEPQEDKYCFWECKNPEIENKPCNNTKCPHYRDNKYYINFKEPDNFMRLFCLIVSIDSYSYRTDNCTANPEFGRVSYINTPADIYKSKLTDPMDAFIGCVIQCAEYERGTAKLIKNTEWKYE